MISKVGSKIGTNIKEYNVHRQQLSSSKLPPTLCYDDVVQVESTIWSWREHRAEDALFNVKQRVILLHSLKQRAMEERCYIEADVAAAKNFYSHQQEVFHGASLNYAEHNRFCMGARAILSKKIEENRNSWQKAVNFEKDFLSGTPVADVPEEEGYEDEDDDEEEYEEEVDDDDVEEEVEFF